MENYAKLMTDKSALNNIYLNANNTGSSSMHTCPLLVPHDPCGINHTRLSTVTLYNLTNPKSTTPKTLDAPWRLYDGKSLKHI